MKKLLTILLFSLLFSCTKQETSIPEDVLPKDKMAEVLTDFQLAETVVRLQLNYKDSITESSLFDKVFEKHQISKEQFDKSFTFYTKHPTILKEIYDECIVNFTEKQAELQGKLNEQRKKNQ
jgi:hypothetical protein